MTSTLHAYRVTYLYDNDETEYVRTYDALSAEEAMRATELAAAMDNESITVIRCEDLDLDLIRGSK